MLSIPSLYNDTYQTKLAVEPVCAGDEQKYGPFEVFMDDYSHELLSESIILLLSTYDACVILVLFTIGTFQRSFMA